MQSFKFFLNEQETKLATVADLDKDFMRSAMKSTSFNLNGNKPIITNGLVYALDFGNTKSYVSGV